MFKYMRILITIMILWSSTMAFGQEIWQLSPWAPDSSYVIGAMNSGEPTWVKVDSLGLADSIYLSGDNIKLRDGAGVAQLPTASTSTKGLLTSTDWNTFNGKVGGSGTATRVAFWNGTNSLSSNSNFHWDNVNGRLGIGTALPNYNLHINGTSWMSQTLNLAGVGSHLRMVASGNLLDNANDGGFYTSVLGDIYLANWNQNRGWNIKSDGDIVTLGTGNFGVGVSPSYKIHSGGTIAANGTMHALAIGGNIRLRADGTSSKDGALYTTAGGDFNLANWDGNRGFVIKSGGNIETLGSGNLGVGVSPSRKIDINGEVRIRDLVTDTPTRIVGADADGDLGEIVLGTGLSFTGNTLNATGGSGSTEYLDPYIISSDTVGFILKNVQDTVQFIGVAGVTGESTTVSDSPTINMTLTGTNISSEVIDGSITPTKLSQTYLITEVDGSTTNEIQTLSIAGNNLTISGTGGNTVTLPSGGGSSEWASLHYGSLAANTQTLTSSVWNTINFTGSSESNASIIDANHTNDEIEFVVAGTYRVDYRVSFIANADALIYSGIYSSVSSSVDGNTQMESDTDSGYKHTIMQHSYIKTAVAGEKIKLQVQPLIAHTSVAIYSNFIVTKL